MQIVLLHLSARYILMIRGSRAVMSKDWLGHPGSATTNSPRMLAKCVRKRHCTRLLMSSPHKLQIRRTTSRRGQRCLQHTKR
jgi:hypothetical protein